MSNTSMNMPSLSPDDAKRLDEEFEREFQTGTLPKSNLEPLDPLTDPFGRGYSWLNPPTNPMIVAYEKLVNCTRDELMKNNGQELRASVLAGEFAAGTNEAILQKWASENFPSLCRSTVDGELILELLQTKSEVSREVVLEIVNILDVHPEFNSLPIEQRMAAALIVVDYYRQSFEKQS